MVLRRTGCQLIQSNHRIASRLSTQLQHGEQIVRTVTHVAQTSHLFGNHAQLLKVYHVFYSRIVTQMDESEVFFHDRVERNLKQNSGIMQNAQMRHSFNAIGVLFLAPNACYK